MRIGIVWIKMNPKDTFEAAQNSSEKFSDPRVSQFFDPFQTTGKILAQKLPMNATVAWDIYLFYEKNKTWDSDLSDPIEWMHQMSDTDADSDHLRCGDDLVRGLYDSMRSITKSE